MSTAATIFAPATPPGRAGVAVLRISGPGAGPALSALCGGIPLPPPREARLRRLVDTEGATLDNALVVWLPAPASFTGEDTVELHLHGSPAVLDDVAACLATLPDLRPAAAGDFTRRAFDNGRLDLAEVEGLADLIDAQTAMQRKQALRQMGGALSARIDTWRTRLIQAQAHLEAVIDFGDEDLPPGLLEEVAASAQDLAAEMAATLTEGHRGERVREGVSVAILGAPNAGKSSLLNVLARRDAAIVAETAGTTRDVVEVHLDLGGYPVTLADTAGLRDVAVSGDPIEVEGMRRARARAAAADLRLAVFDLSAGPAGDPATREVLGPDTLAVGNKVDRLTGPPPARLDGQPLHAISVATGAGIAALLDTLTQAVAARFTPGESGGITRARHREALSATCEALERAQTAPLPELMAEDLRLAIRALGRITGRVDVEDILDVIFADFCIGK